MLKGFMIMLVGVWWFFSLVVGGNRIKKVSTLLYWALGSLKTNPKMIKI
jgi:hypothetical protein